jgi:hypothetical protein
MTKIKVKKQIDELINPDSRRHTMVIFVRGIYVPKSGSADNGGTLREQINDYKKTHDTGASLYHHIPYSEGITVECDSPETAEALIKLRKLPMPGVEVSDFHWPIADML